VKRWGRTPRIRFAGHAAADPVCRLAIRGAQSGSAWRALR